MPNAKFDETVMASSGASLQEIDAQRQINLIQNIDDLVGRAARSLIELAATHQPKPGEDPHQDVCREALYFPPWIGGDSGPPPKGTYLLTRAQCCATLQRLWENKRRYPWLTRDELTTLDKLGPRFSSTFIPSKVRQFRRPLEDYAECVSSSTFCGVNPLTASQVFRVLIYGGETKAHKGIGFFAFFVMVWFLLRRFPVGSIRGVSLEASRPTAYVTAKCLFPIKLLADICYRRAGHYEDLQNLITKLEQVACDPVSVSNRWKFASTLSELSINLSDLSNVSIASDAFRNCSHSVEALADELDSYKISATSWKRVKSELIEALRLAAGESKTIWNEGDGVVNQIKQQIIKRLKERDAKGLAKYKINLTVPKENEAKYWADHVSAAEEALSICNDAVLYLKSASELQSIGNGADTKVLLTALGGIAHANRDLSHTFSRTGADSARWCRSVVEREIAHASAGNATDFDAAELVSGIATAVRWRQMTSPLEIADATRKAIEGGSRPDGTWMPGLPVYTHGRLLGAYPITSDIVWLLTSAIKTYPAVNVADVAMEHYVSWLGRRISEVAIKYAGGQVRMTGWASERSCERNRVDLGATAFSINALLEIRDLAEDRIWQACEQRFNIISPTKSLTGVDAVDLGASHKYRLHRRLLKMAREAQTGEPDAEYAFMLHGPPGSSKTAMAQAVAREMWRTPSRRSVKPTRLVRITPADFTRFGEDRLDSEARVIFALITHIRGAVILFDEVDDLLRKRDTATRPVFMELIIPAMLNRLADLREACPRQEVCYIFATNFVQNIEAALMRRGRLDATVPVVYPDTESRLSLIERRIEKLPGISQDLEKVKEEFVRQTRFWPWMIIEDFLDELCESTPISDAVLRELAKRYEPELNIPPYSMKVLFKGPIPRQLLDELLHYSFSGWRTLQEYKAEFEKQLEAWRSEQSKVEGYPFDLSRVHEIVRLGAELWVREGRPDVPLRITRGKGDGSAKAA